MRRYTHTEAEPSPFWISLLSFGGGGIGVGVLIWLVGFSTDNGILRQSAELGPTRFDQPPQYVGLLDLRKNKPKARPFALTLHEGNLLVSFLGSDEIVEYSSDFTHTRSFHILDGNDASLTSLIIDGDRLYAANFRSGELLMIAYPSGMLLGSYGLFPDARTRMKLFGLTFAMGNIYASDSQTNQILAISATTVPGIKEEGELLMTFPTRVSADRQLSFPTFAAVTPDGRLLVSDVGHKQVRAFTCSGRPAHNFDTSAAASFSVPMGIAFDDLPSPEFLAMADTILNPSGVFQQGRIHVVDTEQASVKVFNSLGKYVLSYGRELRQPNGIAIDQKRKLIFIADSDRGSILAYTY